MWHLFGPLVRWPLHSPLRLLGVVVAAIAAVMLLGAINDRGAQAGAAAVTSATAVESSESTAARADPTAPTSSATEPEAETASATAPATDALSSDPAEDSPVVAAQQAAAEFVAAWARPDLDAPSWQAGLVAHTTPSFLASLADTDPANLPAVTVAGQPVEVAANAEAGVFDVPTTGDFVRVVVELVDGAWLATDVQPTR